MKPVLKINNKYAESLERVRGWLIAFAIIAIIVGVIILVISDTEAGWELLIASIPLFILAGTTNGFIGMAKAAAIYTAKLNEEYDIQNEEQK